MVLDGLEVFKEPFSINQQTFLQIMQKKYDFITSFGTDYHGKPNQQKTFLEVEEKLIEELLS